ncbi:NAD(P)H-binding protein [Streptomyces subrutilus]|uniref:NAD(P)-dependent oxidoreductase n=1 Tax=Streptomyces subrutilus TaxID=36818 RepID=A0A1E5P060_9ACTN|nr:NAD(P)H-binding protein [Streptomyces subrutilus]OEJ22425.1 NAD(P)-dependent oxidoreductase [Streptomyces subrutilus]
MILVTGATGTVGREVARLLPAGQPVRIAARDPARLADDVRGEVVRADYRDQPSLERALGGVRAVFLVTSRVGEDDARIIEAARRAGVGHVVKLSAASVADPHADDLITRWQRVNEELLRGSGMDWTLLRPRSFMSNSLSWAASIRTEQVVRAVYGSSANACVDPRDIAEVAVHALTEPGHTGVIHTLTGPEGITAAEQTAHLAAVLGRGIRFEELSPAQARAGWLERYPEPLVEALLHSARRQQAGAKAEVRDTVMDVTGRPATPFRTWARDHRAAFGPA